MARRGTATVGPNLGAIHEGFLRHKSCRWLKIALPLSLAAVVGYALVDVHPRHNGGSWYGYTLGILATLLILWLTLLGLRKRAMTRGRWSLKGWTSAHVYLGLSLTVVATLHTGFQFGWNVHTFAYALMIAVILSGVYGVLVYALLPPVLSNSRVEMTRPQMIDALGRLDRQLQSAAQPLGDAEAAVLERAIAENPFCSGLLRLLSGRDPRCAIDRALSQMRRRLSSAHGADAVALDAAVQLLERKSAALAQVRRYLRIKTLLEVWLYIHVPLSFALIAALAAHIVSVFFYW